jgi:hypothetical protein
MGFDENIEFSDVKQKRNVQKVYSFVRNLKHHDYLSDQKTHEWNHPCIQTEVCGCNR